MDESDRMSSVSNSSKFSVKSQIVIANQDVMIAAMRSAMLKTLKIHAGELQNVELGKRVHAEWGINVLLVFSSIYYVN